MLKLVLQRCAALAIAGVASYLLLVRAPLEQLEQARARHLELQEEYLQRQAYRVNLSLHRSQAQVMQDLGKAARMALPDFDGLGAAPRDLEEAIRQAAQEKKLTSRLEFTIGDWSSKEFYYFRPFTVRVNGELRPILAFLQSVSTGSVQLHTVKTASLRPLAGSDEVTLSLDALAIRFRTDEQAAAARKAKAQ